MKAIHILSLLTALLMLGGCATPAQQAAMVPEAKNYSKYFNKSVNVQVTGGEETNPMWASKVSSKDFDGALETAIKESGLFSSVINTDTGDYRLDVRLIELKQPMIGINFTVTATSQWRLRESIDDPEIWNENITTDYTAGMGEAVVAIKRLRLANEGAIRENIKVGLDKLSKLNL